jgi:ABC-2 type transport system permease protein
MSTLSYAVSDSLTMVRRNFRHTLRYPTTIIMSLGVPTLLLLLFVGVFGGALNAGMGGDTHGDVHGGDYIDYVVPGILLMTVGYGASTTALAVNGDMTEGIISRFRTMAISRASVLTGHVVGATIRTMVSVGLLIGVALLMGFRPAAGPGEWLATAGLMVLLVLALTWLAVPIGLAAKNSQGTSGFVLIVQTLPFLSSAFVTPGSMSGAVRWFAENEPFTPIIDTLRGCHVVERREHPPGRFQRAVQFVAALPEVAHHAVGHARHQRLVAVAQFKHSRRIRRGTQHDLGGPAQGVRRGRRKTAQGDQIAQRARRCLHDEAADRAQHQRGPGGLDESGLGPEMRQDPRGLLGHRGHAREVRLDHPQAAEYGRGRRDGRAVAFVERVTQRLHEVVLVRPGLFGERDEVGVEGRLLVPDPEVTGPREETTGHRVGLAGVVPACRAELTHGLQHPEARAGLGVGHLEQRLVNELFQDLQGIVPDQVPRRVGGESAREDRQRAHRRLRHGFQEVPAPVDDGVQRAVPSRRVPCAATQQREPVVQAAGDLGDGQDPDPCRGQFHGERQSVQVAAHLPHRLHGQVDVGAGRPRALVEQLYRRGQVQLWQQVHRLRRQAERGAARGEHPRVLAHRHQGVHQVRGSVHDVLAVVQDQQPGAEGGQDVGEDVRGDGETADRVGSALTDTEGGRDLGRDVIIGGDAGERDEMHHALLGLAADDVREARLAQAAGTDDRRDPGRAQQVGHRGDIVVATEQRVGFMPDTVPGHGRVGLQQVLMHVPQRGTGIAAEFVPQ